MIKDQKIFKKYKTLFTKHKKIVFIFVFLLIVVTGFIGWKTIVRNKNKKSQIQTTAVEKGMLISSVSASGQVLSVNIMSANTKASGLISQVYVKDGDLVKKGDKILDIDLDFQGEQKHAQAWSSYLSAKNSLESAKITKYSLQSDMLAKWDTFKLLAESDTYKDFHSDSRNLPEFYIAQNDWLAAEAKYKNQEAAIIQSQAALNSSWMDYQLSSPTLTAPTDGVITSLMYAEGMSLGTLDTGNSTSNQKVATIKTEGTPIISVNLSEIDVSRVELDQKATIVLDSLPDKTFTGKVIGVDKIGQTNSGVTQYPAILRLDSSAEEILPNMTVTANIVIVRKDNVLLLPSGAIQIQNGQNYVSVLVDDKPRSVPIDTGLFSDTQTEIVSGLNEGDVVVTGSVSSTIQSQTNGTSPFGGGMGGMMRIAR